MWYCLQDVIYTHRLAQIKEEIKAAAFYSHHSNAGGGKSAWGVPPLCISTEFSPGLHFPSSKHGFYSKNKTWQNACRYETTCALRLEGGEGNKPAWRGCEDHAQCSSSPADTSWEVLFLWTQKFLDSLIISLEKNSPFPEESVQNVLSLLIQNRAYSKKWTERKTELVLKLSRSCYGNV